MDCLRNCFSGLNFGHCRTDSSQLSSCYSTSLNSKGFISPFLHTVELPGKFMLALLVVIIVWFGTAQHTSFIPSKIKLPKNWIWGVREWLKQFQELKCTWHTIVDMNRKQAWDIVISRTVVSLNRKSYVINECSSRCLYTNSKNLNYKNEQAFEHS